MSYGDGIDRYEAQSIAESAAHNAASEAERNIGYQIQRVEDDLRSLRHHIDEEAASRRAVVDEIWESLGELREQLLAKADVA